jgi:hypothetical protein
MTMVPNPVLYGAVARERQERHRSAIARSGRRSTPPGLRVRLGRLLISAGTTISGDCIELHPRRATRRPYAA